jgi:outer membrane protein assembly factor BamD (BamD/ComL family)
MIECSKEEQLARESVIRKVDGLVWDLEQFKSKIETHKNLYESYFAIGIQELAIEYGKLILLSMEYSCQPKLKEQGNDELY